MYVYIYIHTYMKTICPPGYEHNGFVATHGLRHMMPTCMCCYKAIVVITRSAHSFHDYIYNMLNLLLFALDFFNCISIKVKSINLRSYCSFGPPIAFIDLGKNK